MADLLVRGARLLLAPIEEGDCLVRGGHIAALGQVPPSTIPPNCPVLDAAGRYLAPGFIDMHVHGGGGADFMDAKPEAIRTITAFHAAHGTTTLLAAIIPAPMDRMRQAMAAVAEVTEPGIAGLYLEGPFVSRAKKGAFNPRWLRSPSVRTFRKLVEGHQNLVKVVTFAPERPKADQLLANILAIGALPAIGHTAATYEQAMDALAHGARHFTHLGNAMSDLHHREPGAVGAALDSDAYVELICDGIHLHPAFVRLIAEVKGYERICLITDAIAAAGLPDGEFALGDLPVFVHQGIARLSNGTLAGSTLTMNRAVKNFMKFTGCSLPEAVRCATLNPARLLGIDERKGSLGVGKDADLVIFDDDFNVHYTILGGKIVYARED